MAKRLDKERFKISKSNRHKFRTTIPIDANLYEYLADVAERFGFTDVDTLCSDIVYSYCNRNRKRLLKKGFSKRKPKKFIKIQGSGRNLNTINAYAYASDMSFDSVISLILKQAMAKIKKNRYEIGLEPISDSVDDSEEANNQNNKNESNENNESSTIH
jgi:hypothetical protein